MENAVRKVSGAGVFSRRGNAPGTPRCPGVKGIVAVIVILLACSSVRAADELPTPDQIKAMQEAKDWSGLLKATTRVLLLKGPAAEPYNRSELWLAKAEAQLHLNQFVPASDSFLNAAKETGTPADVADKAFAMSLIAKKTDAKGYRAGVSKTDNAGNANIPILEPAARELAMKHLFDTEYAEAKKAADKANSLTLATRFVKQAQPTRRLERAATGADAKMNELTEKVLTELSADVKKWVDESTTRVEQIEKEAATLVITRDQLGNESAAPRGPTQQQSRELKDMAKKCEGFAKEFGDLVEVLGGEPPTLAEVPRSVENLYDRAKRGAVIAGSGL